MRFLVSVLAALAVVPALSCTGEDPIVTTGPVGDAAATGDATAPTDGAVEDGGGAVADGAVADGSVGDAGPIPVTPGDVVVLSGETLTTGAGDKITEWKNAIAPLSVVAKPVNAAGPIKIAATLRSGESVACAVWSEGDSALSAPADAAFAFGTDDYSVTAVVQQGPAIVDMRDDGRVVASIVNVNLSTGEYAGFALMTEYQDAQRTSGSKAVKFATRIKYAGGSATEAVEPTLSSTTLQVVAAYRRGDSMYLRVGATTYGPTAGASLVAVPSGKPLVLGSTRTDGDPNTRFAGRLCALIIHRGPESDAAITTRVAALSARFLLP